MNDRSKIGFGLFETDSFQKTYFAYLLRLVGLCFGLIVVLAAAATLVLGGSFQRLLEVLVLCTGLIAIILAGVNFVWLPRYARRVVASVTFYEQHYWGFEADGLHLVTPTVRKRFPWGEVTRWEATDQVLIIYLNQAMPVLLRLDVLGEERLNFIQECLRASDLPEPWKNRK